MAATKEISATSARIAIHVAERGTNTRRGSLRCQIGDNVQFSTTRLESYFFARWEPNAYDALLVAAAVEFGDRTQRRPSLTWQREIDLHIPVHDPDLWNNSRVTEALHDALDFLTGDRWHIAFYERRKPMDQPLQGLLSLHDGVDAVIPFSNGLDSRAVAGLMEREMGNRLVRVRLGSRLRDGEALARQRQAFTSVPYHVRAGARPFVESTARSRGFKFALISGLAAYLANASQVIVPESGQGALGPTLVTVGQAYEDYRSHPLFTGRMERFLDALLGYRGRFSFPQLWFTKAETLKKFVNECEGASAWTETWSCWQQNRHVSVNHKKRQCGICAACMLRRLSVHASGLTEPIDTYVWEDLAAPTFPAGAAASFAKTKITTALREYAIAGALHLDHLAGLLDSPANARMLALNAFQLGSALGVPESEIRSRLNRLLLQHRREWNDFMLSLGKTSFVADWALSARS
jgi:hypothetical protein